MAKIKAPLNVFQQFRQTNPQYKDLDDRAVLGIVSQTTKRPFNELESKYLPKNPIDAFRVKNPQYKDATDDEVMNIASQATGKTVEEIKQRVTPVEKPAPKAGDMTLGDFIKSTGVGVGDTLQGLGYLAEKIGAEKAGKGFKESGERYQKGFASRLTDAGKKALNSEIFEDAPDSLIGARLGDDAGAALLMTVGRSLPATFASVIPGALMTSGLQALAKLGLVGGSSATIPLLAGTASGVTKGGKAIAAIPSAVGYGAAEGLTAGATNAASLEASVKSMPFQELNKSPVFVKLSQQYGDEKARDMLAKQAADDVFKSTGTAVGAIGAVTGGGVLGSIARKVAGQAPAQGVIKTVAKGAAGEALQEAPQSGAEKLLSNITEKELIDPSIDIGSGVTAAALSGAAAGAVTGGVLNLPTARIGRPRQIPEAEPTQATEPIQTPEQAQSGVVKQATEQAAGLAKQASNINVGKTVENLGKVATATTTDDAIKAAQAVVDTKPITAKDIFDTEQGRNELLNAINKSTVTIPGAITEGLNYGQTNEAKQTEKTGETDSLSVLEAKAKKQLQIVEQNLVKEDLARQGGDTSPRNQHALEFLTNRKRLLETQIAEQAYVPKTKIDELDRLITGQEQRKITDADTWSDLDQRVLDQAYAKRDELVQIESLDTFPPAAEPAYGGDTEAAPEEIVAAEPTTAEKPVEASVFDRIEEPVSQPKPTDKQLYERLSSPTTSREQFAQDVVRLITDADGNAPRFNSAGAFFDYLNTRNLAEGTKYPIDGDAILRRFDTALIQQVIDDNAKRTEALTNPESVYKEAKVRSDSTAEVLEQGQKAYADRLQKAAARVNATPLAVRLSNDFKEGSGSSLVGKAVSDIHDVAQLAQVLRDPRFETLRIFIIGQDRVLNHYALSSRLPGAIHFDLDNVISAIDSYIRNTPGATGWALVHNHPSGDPTPSGGDISTTIKMAEDAPGFIGHVVIDTGKYATIDANGNYKFNAVTNAEFGKVGLDHWAINLKLEGYGDIADLAKSFQNKDGFFTLVGLDTRLRVAAIAEVPDTAMKLDKLKLIANLRQFARGSGTSKMVAVLPENSPLKHDPKLIAAIESGLINEVIDIRNGQALPISPNEFEEVFGVKRKPSMGDAPRQNAKLTRLEAKSNKSLKAINDKLAALNQTQQQMAAQIKATSKLKQQVKANAEAKIEGALLANLRTAAKQSITPSRRMNQAQRLQNVEGPSPTNVAPVAPAAPEVTKEESLRTIWQDNMIRMKTLQQFVEKQTGKKLSEQADVYTRENLSKATTANKIEDFRKDYISNLVANAGKSGIDINELAEYLEMRHIPEANAYQRFIHNDKGATVNGIPDSTAYAVLNKYKARKDFKRFEQLAGRMWEIGNMTLDLRLKNGLISSEQVAAYKGRYEHWVPLRGENVKFSVKDKRRFGHLSRDEFVFENLVLGHEIAIMQAEQNKLAMSIASFLIEADNPNIGTISAPRKFATLDNFAYAVSHNGLDITSFRTKEQAELFIEQVRDKKRSSHAFVITKTSDPQVILRTRPFLQPNEVALYINGHEVRMQINDETAANALNRVGLEGLGGILAMARGLNNFLSKSYTAWSPDFIFTNVARDLGGGTFVLTGEYGAKIAAKVVGNYAKAISRLIAHARGKSDPIVEQYRTYGGNTGAAYLEDIERIGRTAVSTVMEQMNTITAYNTAYKHIENEARRKGLLLKPGAIARKAALKTGFSRIGKIPVLGHFLKVMEAINGVAENALRVSTFETLIKEGKSPQEAAFAAKNLMNFNRKGTIANQAGALYLFFNPGLQGTQVFARAFSRSPNRKQVWALGATMATVSFLIAQFTRGGGEDDERKWSGIPGHVKDRNLVVDFNGWQATVPVSYGFGIFHTFGNLMSDVGNGEKASTAAWRMASSLFTHFFVFGDPIVETKGEYDVRLDMLLPTAAKLGVAPYTNMDGLGRPIYPFSFSDSVPDSQKMTRSARNTWYEGLAYTLNDITGGDKYTAGGIDVSPNVIKYWVESLTGGWGKFAADASRMTVNAVQGVAPEIENVPIARKFIRSPGVSDMRTNFWRESNDVERDYKRMKAMQRDNAPELNFIPEEKRADIQAIYRLMDSQRKLAAKLRNSMLEVQRDDTLSAKERNLKIKELERQESNAYETFLNDFNLRKEDGR